MTALLELEGADVHYGDFQAVFDVSLSVSAGETLAVIGANGAGKSTLLKTIVGLVPSSKGEIRFGGHNIAAWPVHRRVIEGIALVPEGRRLFSSLTVVENLMAGAYRGRRGPWSLDSVYELFPLVHDRRNRASTSLSGGEQQAVAIGRALMSNPTLLLLDEVSLGLAPVVVKQLYAALPQISANGTAVLLVEQDVSQALAAADRVHCLLEGRTVLQGNASEVSMDEISSAYFGLEAGAS